MSRDEVLRLLKQQIPAEVVDLAARRNPDIEPPLELVPRALTLLAERENSTERIAGAIPALSEQCRTLLRLRLQGRSFEEIGEELDTDAAAVYLRCRRKLLRGSKPLPGYAAGLLNRDQRLSLFAWALQDSAVFRSLKDDQALLAAMESPAARVQLLEATEHWRFTIAGGLREWFERPRSKIIVLAGLVAGLMILVRECGGGGLRH
jgi:hypothetical protein